jgi:probable HAF family extracellular repeat protein
MGGIAVNHMEMEKHMRFVFTTTLILVLTASASSMFGQAFPTHQQPKSRRYKFVDIGSLGGPASYGSASGVGSVNLNNHGEIGAYADIDAPDPYAPNCFNNDCFLSHTFRWRHGRIDDLGPGGGNASAFSGINLAGWIVGFSRTDVIDPVTGFPENRAILWKNHSPQDLGTFGGNQSISIYVNDEGQVIGLADTAVPDAYSMFGTGYQDHTFIWEHGTKFDIGTLGGPDAVPSAICENSRKYFVTGQSYTSFSPNPDTGLLDVAPFLWDRGLMMNLGSLGGTFGYGQCANNRGQVIGQSNLAGDLEQHAFLWTKGAMKDLGTLGGSFSLANWLDHAGVVVGGATTENDEFFHAALWKGGSATDLGTIPGYDCSNALARNSNGQVVGQAFDCVTQLQHATTWEDGQIVDLNSVIPPGSSLELVEAFNINERGEILGAGVPPGVPPTGDEVDTVGRLFLLIPCESERNHSDDGCEFAEASVGMSSVASENSTAHVHRALTPESFWALRARVGRSRRARIEAAQPQNYSLPR